MITLSDYVTKILVWADQRNLIKGSTPEKQMLKLTEEYGELASGLCRGNMSKVKDSVGDMIVVLTILTEQLGLDMEDCVAQAWDDIKDRKGKMVDGVFIKEEDLPHGA